MTVHGLDWQREKWGKFARWFLRRCEGPAAHLPDRTIVVSKTPAPALPRGAPLRRRVIPNGTNRSCGPKKITQLRLVPGKYVLFDGS